MEKLRFKNENAQRILGILQNFSCVEFEVFFRKGQPKILNEESTTFNNVSGQYCDQRMFESAFLEFEMNKDGSMDGWYRAVALLSYNDAQCSHPETGQNDFDAYWCPDHVEFTFLAKTRKEIIARRREEWATLGLPF